MGRKKKNEEQANNERWLARHPDFITLVFGFFVVMFSVSQVDSKKVGRFTESFNEALQWQVFDAKGGNALMPGGYSGDTSTPLVSKNPAEISQLDYHGQKAAIRSGLSRRKQKVPELGGLKVLEVHGELVLRLPEKLMFDVADADLHEDGRKALAA